jgi:hypothetical protein
MKVLDHNINSKFCRVVMIFERVPGVCDVWNRHLLKQRRYEQENE